MTAQSRTGRASTTRTAFRLAISVTTAIDAPPATIWNLLTDLKAHSRWNSTLTSIEGEVALGKQVTFEIPEAPGQKFPNKVIHYEERRSMVWQLNRWPLLVGARTYRLTPMPDGSTEFSMTEVFSGLLLPLAAKTFPDFGLMFERTAADLGAAATSPSP